MLLGQSKIRLTAIIIDEMQNFVYFIDKIFNKLSGFFLHKNL